VKPATIPQSTAPPGTGTVSTAYASHVTHIVHTTIHYRVLTSIQYSIRCRVCTWQSCASPPCGPHLPSSRAVRDHGPGGGTRAREPVPCGVQRTLSRSVIVATPRVRRPHVGIRAVHWQGCDEMGRTRRARRPPRGLRPTSRARMPPQPEGPPHGQHSPRARRRNPTAAEPSWSLPCQKRPPDLADEESLTPGAA
jgi:hypothetical protein